MLDLLNDWIDSHDVKVENRSANAKKETAALFRISMHSHVPFLLVLWHSSIHVFFNGSNSDCRFGLNDVIRNPSPLLGRCISQMVGDRDASF